MAIRAIKTFLNLKSYIYVMGRIIGTYRAIVMIWDNSITYKIQGLEYSRNSINDEIDL